MHTLKLEIEDSKLDVMTRYEIINENRKQKDFINISKKTLSKVWDNKEDSVYDKYLKV